MPIRNLWFNYRLECIEVFLSRAFQVRDEYIAALGSTDAEDECEDYPGTLQELEHATDILLGYQDIVFRAVHAELNALVELELKHLARSILTSSGEKSRKLNRGNARTIIEQEYGIRLHDLPRYEEVDEVRKIINAYKHEDGFSNDYQEAFPGAGILFGLWDTRYKLSWEKTEQSVQAVKEFLLALPGDREHRPEVRRKPEDEETAAVRRQTWEYLRQSGALGHQLGPPVPDACRGVGYSATCQLCGKSFWAEWKEMLDAVAALDVGNCPGVTD